MKTLKDILEVPLSDLSKGIKLWVDHSCQFWESWLDEYGVSTAVKAGEETIETTENEVEKPKLPDDLATVIELNKAIVEKYQASGAQSLLNHLVAQLAKERNIKLDDILDEGEVVKDILLKEIKDALDVSPEKRELLKLDSAERAEFVVNRVIGENPDSIDKIINGDKSVIKELDEKVIKSACDTVDISDLKYALRSVIQSKLYKLQNAKANA